MIAPLMVGLVLFGFYPMPLLDVSNPTVDTLLQHVGVSDDEPVVPAAEHDSARGRPAVITLVTQSGFSKPSIEYAELWPMLLVFGVACVGVLVEAFLPRERRYVVQAVLALAGLVGAFVGVCLVAARPRPRSAAVPPAACSRPRARSSSTAPRSSCGA